jgi:hypothetical protein
VLAFVPAQSPQITSTATDTIKFNGNQPVLNQLEEIYGHITGMSAGSEVACALLT